MIMIVRNRKCPKIAVLWYVSFLLLPRFVAAALPEYPLWSPGKLEALWQSCETIADFEQKLQRLEIEYVEVLQEFTSAEFLEYTKNYGFGEEDTFIMAAKLFWPYHLPENFPFVLNYGSCWLSLRDLMGSLKKSKQSIRQKKQKFEDWVICLNTAYPPTFMPEMAAKLKRCIRTQLQ